MNELKSFNSERIYWAVEQVEQEAGDIDTLHLDDALFYLKPEADAVIAKLEKKVDLYKRGWAENDRINSHLYAELRHQKYRRCLAMASLSLEKSETYRAEYEEWCLKWYKRWLELAEKFNVGTIIEIHNAQTPEFAVSLGRVCKSCTDKYCQFPIQRISFKEALKRHFKAVKDTTCNCLFCRNLNKEPNNG